jgi:putative endonuclease
VSQHNGSKRGAQYTKTRRPVVLVHSERFRTKGDALRREAELKGLRRKEKLDLIAKTNS